MALYAYNGRIALCDFQKNSLVIAYFIRKTNIHFLLFHFRQSQAAPLSQYLISTSAEVPMRVYQACIKKNVYETEDEFYFMILCPECKL